MLGSADLESGLVVVLACLLESFEDIEHVIDEGFDSGSRLVSSHHPDDARRRNHGDIVNGGFGLDVLGDELC